MTRGRKPLPAAVKERRGSFKVHPERRKDNPKSSGLPVKPERFDGVASDEWEWMVSKLSEMGIIESADQKALEIYCDTYADWRLACEKVEEYGLAIHGVDQMGNETVKRNPYLTAKNHSADRCFKLLVEFGLTPSSRSRLEKKAEESGSDWFEEALKSRMNSN